MSNKKLCTQIVPKIKKTQGLVKELHWDHKLT